MRDTFRAFKDIHVKLDKDTYLALRTLTFKYDMSIQEIFNEVAMMITTESRDGMKIVNAINRRKLKEVLDGRIMIEPTVEPMQPSGKKRTRRTKLTNLSRLDSEKLYTILDDADQAKREKQEKEEDVQEDY